jgi:hypothetical protein
MLIFMAHTLTGKVAASLETRYYEFSPSDGPYDPLQYPIKAYGTLVGLGYYFREGLGLHLLIGGGYGKYNFLRATGYSNEYEEVRRYFSLQYKVRSLEGGVAVSLIPFRGDRGLFRVETALTGVWMKSREVVKDSTVIHYFYPDTTIVDGSITTFPIRAYVLSVPLYLGGEYFLTDNVSLGLEYGFYLVRYTNAMHYREVSSDTTYVQFITSLKPAENLRLRATAYFDA